MTVVELLAVAAGRLTATEGLPDPGREARFLLARALQESEAWLLAHPEAAMAEADVSRFLGWVSRRAAGEPAHLIVGTCPFWGREFAVAPGVLIPRPESELIVETALGLPLPRSPRVIDIGTGSGCLAITLALELAGVRVLATDLSLVALATARRNARRLGAQVALACGDLAAHLRGHFELVVANLPYLPTVDLATLPRDVRDFEPALALDGGTDGTQAVSGLLSGLPSLLVPGGWAVLELGIGQADQLGRAADGLGLEEVSRVRDAIGVDRVLVVRA